MKVKNAIKRLVALGTGAVMLGATVMGAAAYDLGDYPTPIFIDSNGNFNGQIVVGAAASNADLLGALDISTSLQRAATQKVQVSTSTVSVSDGDAEEIIIGNSVLTTPGLDSEYLDDDLSVLQDTSIEVGDDTINVHDEIQIGALTVTTSLPSNDEDYQQDVVLTAAKDTLTYCYEIDELVNLSAATDPIKISFLGQTLEITSIGAADQITAQVGKEVYLEAGGSTVVEGKTVTLVKTGTSAAVVDVDGQQGTVTAGGSTEKINGIKVKIDAGDVFNEDGIEFDSATLIVGSDTTKTYSNGEEFIGEDEGDPDWVWKLSALTSTTGQVLCIENDFDRQGANKDPAGVGEFYAFPNDFVKLGIESLTLGDDDYMTFDVGTETNVELDTYGGGPANAKTIVITTGEEESLVIQRNSLDEKTGTTTVKTDTVYLELTSAEVGVFYKDANDYNRIKNAGNETLNSVNDNITFAYVDYGKTQSPDLALVLWGNASAAESTLWLGLVPDSSLADNDALWIDLGDDGSDFDGFGAADDQEDTDITYGNDATPLTSVTNKGGLDEDLLSKYGIKIADPKAGSASDEFNFWIPKDQLKANVVIVPGESAIAGGTSGTYDKIKPITVGLGVLDTNAQANLGGAKPYIVVGGPCANDVAAELMGNPANCVEGFEAGKAKIKWYDSQNALLVAGFNPDDTVGAARVVANYDDYPAEFAAGKTEIAVSIPTLNSIQVETV